MADLTKETVWTGKTYDIRSQLREFGGKWDEAKKAWIVPGLSRRQVVPAQRLMLRQGVDVVND